MAPQQHEHNVKFDFHVKIDPICINLQMPHGSSHAPIMAKLEEIVNFLTSFKESIMSALSDLQAAVAAETTVVQSAIVLLNGLKTKLDEAIASGDPAALTALSASIGADSAALAAAVATNTPVDPPVV